MPKECLLSALASLKESSRSAIADAVCETFTDEKGYLHIERAVEAELEEILCRVSSSESGALILVCGNVGDGKSHLISALRQKRPEYFKDLAIYNDATESSSPTASNIDELRKTLAPYSDANLSRCEKKSILAINLGTLNNFLVADSSGEFTQLTQFADDMRILEVGSVTDTPQKDTDSCFFCVSLCDHNIFHLTDTGPASLLIEEALDKVVSKSRYNNPFRRAYEAHCIDCAANCPIRLNYEILEQEEVRSRISSLLIQCIVKHHHIISIRSLYSFIYDLIVPVALDDLSVQEIEKWTEKYPRHSESYIRNLIPNYLFEHPEISKIFEHLHYLDPSLKRSAELDEQIIRLVTSEDKSGIIEQVSASPLLKEVLHQHAPVSDDDGHDSLVKTYVRLFSLAGNGTAVISFEDKCYAEYMSLLHGWFRGDRTAIKSMYKLVLNSVMLWNGKSVNGEMLIESGNQQLKYRLGEKISIQPGELPTYTDDQDHVHKFSNIITLRFRIGSPGKDLALNMDCRMYDMLRRVVDGYRVNQIDKGNFIAFSSFVSDVMRSGELTNKIRVTEASTGKHFILARDEFGDFTFKSEVLG